MSLAKDLIRAKLNQRMYQRDSTQQVSNMTSTKYKVSPSLFKISFGISK